MASKYDALREHLRRQDRARVEMSFGEVAELVGELPASATGDGGKYHRQWWENNDGHVQARAWLGAGYEVTDVNPTARRVTFVQSSNRQQ